MSMAILTPKKIFKPGFFVSFVLLLGGCTSSRTRIEEQCFRDLSFGKEPVHIVELEERWDQAIKKLGEIRSEKAIPFLVGFIRDSHVRDSINYDGAGILVFDCAEALGRIGKPALPEVQKILSSEVVMQRRLALVALYEMGPEGREASQMVKLVVAIDPSMRNRRLAEEVLRDIEGNSCSAEDS